MSMSKKLPPLAVVSIPKSGTHLLTSLLKVIGYSEGGELPMRPAEGRYYTLGQENAHTFASFATAVEPWHPLTCLPILFIYRHPLDILVSEAHYRVSDSTTAYASALASLSFDERLAKLITGTYLINNLYERISPYLGWLEMGNVIPVSFEELVGSKGGGSDELQHRLISSLLDRLNIEGSAEKIMQDVFSTSSPTFRTGQIGSHKQTLKPLHYQLLKGIPTDFMGILGYDIDSDSPYSSRIEEFRTRTVKLRTAEVDETPILRDNDFFGHNIVLFRKRFYALPQSWGDTDLSSLPTEKLALLISSDDQEQCKLRVAISSLISGNQEMEDLPQLIIENYCQHNIVRYKNIFYAIPLALGPVDVDRLGRNQLLSLPHATVLADLKNILGKLGKAATISLLLPTRARPAWAERFFKSVAEHTTHLDQVEVILYVDEDDTGSHHLSSDEIHVERIIGPRMSMGAYNSACLEKARGEIVILVNDDMVIRTPGWDEKIRALDASFPDGIYLAYGNDLFKGGRLCTFPILSRRACEVLGDPYPAAYRGAFIDYHLFDVFQRLRRLGYDRIRYLEDVVFEHLHFRAGKAEKDAIYTQRNRFGDDPTFVGLREQRAIAAARLKNAIDGVVLTPMAPRNDEVACKLSMAGLGRAFLFDKALPFGWRFFLWYWFLGRYAASRGWLKPFVR